MTRTATNTRKIFGLTVALLMRRHSCCGIGCRCIPYEAGSHHRAFRPGRRHRYSGAASRQEIP